MNESVAPKSKIPPHAERVFSGAIFDIYQWQQELYDGTTATFEIAKRHNTVMVLATQDDKVLVARQEQPGKGIYYDYLGGRSEPGEEPLACAKRELLEEAGLVSDDWQLWAINSIGGKIEWHLYYYIARNCHKVAEPQLDGGEILEVVALDFDTFVHQIVPDPAFHDEYTREILFSLYNPAKAQELADHLFKGAK